MGSHAEMIKGIAAELGGNSVFWHDGGSLLDFMSNRFSETALATETAASILDYFCLEEGKYNEFEHGVSLAVLFLDKAVGKPESGRKQSLVDLKDILHNCDGRDVLVGWAQVWYG